MNDEREHSTPVESTRPSTTENTETTMDHDSTATTGSPTPPGPEPADDPRRVRVGTVVWGLVIAAIGVGLLATVAGFTFDVELALIVLVAAAGVALLVGSIVTSRRRR